MQTISTNLSTLLAQLSKTGFDNGINHVGNNTKKDNTFVDDTASTYAPHMANMLSKYDLTFEKFANFQDMISTAMNGLTSMKQEGEGLRSLIAQAKEGDLSEELLNKIQDEVNSRIAKIQDIKKNTEFDGINPFEQAFSLNIPNWQEMFGISGSENSSEEQNDSMSEVLASISFDMTLGGDSENNSFNIGASATIEIGLAEDGSLMINVDATMDFDLSGLTTGGYEQDGALDLLNRFIELITGKQNDLNTASNIVNSLFAKATANIEGDNFSIFADNNVNIEQSSSENIKGQIVQHASIKLDGSANQSPNIAINIL